MFHRIKQFYWDIASIFYRIDYDFINNYLSEEEKNLFNKLNKAEKSHSIRVAKFAKKQCDDMNKPYNIRKLMKICLLHDIGKCGANLNVFDRTFIVLADKFTKGKLKTYTNINKIYVYYNHPKIAAHKLENLGYDEEFLCAIKKHHEDKVYDNWFLKILKLSDENN